MAERWDIYRLITRAKRSPERVCRRKKKHCLPSVYTRTLGKQFISMGRKVGSKTFSLLFFCLVFQHKTLEFILKSVGMEKKFARTVCRVSAVRHWENTQTPSLSRPHPADEGHMAIVLVEYGCLPSVFYVYFRVFALYWVPFLHNRYMLASVEYYFVCRVFYTRYRCGNSHWLPSSDAPTERSSRLEGVNRRFNYV